MSEEKQIEEMAITACHSINLIKRTLNRKCEDCGLDDKCITQIVCKVLYNAGYRKQSEGEWKTEETILGRCCVCSVCGSCPTLEYKYCPYCGAKMKGE